VNYVLLFAALITQIDCAVTLETRGYGVAAAKLAHPYAQCLNAATGTEADILRRCRSVRAAQLAAGEKRLGKTQARANLTRAIKWLDAMADERANCHTRLQVSQ
jgi:hypothetical protein